RGDHLRVYSAAHQPGGAASGGHPVHFSRLRAMPELPEVETTLRGIAPLVVGRRVALMHLYDRRLRWSVPQWLPARIAGRTIDALDRRSKYLLFRLGSDKLPAHLGMTGSLRAFRAPPPLVPHDHVDIVLDSGVTLRYHDP